MTAGILFLRTVTGLVWALAFFAIALSLLIHVIGNL